MRPPLANLFAVYDENPAMLEEIIQDLQKSGEFIRMWRPAPGWIAASAPLPGGESDGEVVRNNQLAFAEGRDVLENCPGKAHEERFSEIANLADTKPEMLASLPGDFGFIRFRPGGDATVVRSCGGLVPFYLGRFGSRFAISTRLGDFVRYLPDEPQLDPLVNAIWASSWGMFPNGRTFLKGVSILDRGCFARIENGLQMTIESYWKPRPSRVSYPTQSVAQEHAERLRTLLIEKLKQDLDPDDGNLLTLSGGVDSSSLAALAAGTVGRPIWTYSLVPPEDKEDALNYELSYIQPLIEKYKIKRSWFIHHHHRLLVFELWPAAPKIVFHVIHPALCSLPGLLKEAPVRVLFGGEYADNVCGSGLTVHDWVVHTSLLRLLTDFKAVFQDPKAIACWIKRRMKLFMRKPILLFPEKLFEMDPYGEKPLNLFHPEVCEEYRYWYEERKKELLQDKYG